MITLTHFFNSTISTLSIIFKSIFGRSGASTIREQDFRHEQELELQRHKNRLEDERISKILENINDDEVLLKSKKIREDIEYLNKNVDYSI